jgi:hypothetical protein
MNPVIAVKPIGNGWSVKADAFESEMVFLSGAKAEAAARRLAKTLSENGQASQIRIFLRNGDLAAEFAVPALHGAMAG